MSPLTKNAPKIHDARSDSDRPPRVPTARMIATGPDAAKMKATSALAAYRPPKSAMTCLIEGGAAASFSSGTFRIFRYRAKNRRIKSI